MNITGLFNTAAITSEIKIVLSKLFALLKCPCVKFMESHMYNKPMQANTVPMNKTTRIAKMRCLLISFFISTKLKLNIYITILILFLLNFYSYYFIYHTTHAIFFGIV